MREEIKGAQSAHPPPIETDLLKSRGACTPPCLPVPPSLEIMAIRVVEFSIRGYKIRKIFDSESTYSKEIIEF